MLEENLGKLLVISRTISQAFYHLTFPASHLSYLKQQLLTLTKILNQKTKNQKSQSPKACSHSQAQRNRVFTHFLSDFWISYLTVMRERRWVPQPGIPTKHTFILDAY